MNNNASDSGCDTSAAKARCGRLDFPVLLLVVAAAFVGGNVAPPIRTWFPGLDSEQPQEEAIAKEPQKPASKPAELAAQWTRLRDQTEQNLQVAETILTVMRAKKLADEDLRAQEKKIEALKAKRDLYDKRLQELAERNPQLGNATQGRKEEINADELDIQHRRWLDQERLKRIVPADKP